MARITPNPKARIVLLPIPVNGEEKASIAHRAHAARMKTAVFVRTMALEGRVVSVPAINDADRVELRRQGHNLNQLARAMNGARNPEVYPTLTAIRGLLQRIDERLAGR